MRGSTKAKRPQKPQAPPAMRLARALERYPLPRTPAQLRRIQVAVNQALGHALSLRGAAKKSAMRKLAGMPLANVVDQDTLAVLRDPQWFAKKEKATHDEAA